MAKLEMSPGFYNSNFKNYIFTSTRSNYPPNQAISPLFASAFYYSSYFYVLKGTVPTNFTNILSRTSDILISWWLGDYANAAQYSINITNNPVLVSGNGVAASASGTATWFWARQVWQNSQGPYVETHQGLIGTVGTFGSGSDLEMQSTTIQSGLYYRFTNLTIQFPLIWEF